MATAEELLAAETGSNKILTIDSDLRTIAIPSGFGVFGVESDDDVLRVHFRGPRYYHDVDLSTFEIRVNINNAKGEPDVFPVTDMVVEDETDTIVFTWLIGRFTAQYRGTIEFALCFREIDSEGVVTREFNTTTANGTILKGLEATGQVVQRYPDILESILLRLDGIEENGVPGGPDPVNIELDTTLTQEGKAADAKAVGDAINDAKPLVVSISSDNVALATHGSTEIYQHVISGGTVVFQAAGSQATLLSSTTRLATFSTGAIPNGTADKLYENRITIDADKNFTTNTVEINPGATEEQVTQIQNNTDNIAEIQLQVISGELTIESQKYTMTLTMEDGSIETHVLETDENDYPTKLTVNGREIPWTVTGV